ncbi:MAG: hypothetical protein ACOC3Z_01730 [Nanoarchaeota archaeon]
MKKTIVKLITRFIGNKCVTFDGSRVYYWKVPMIILPFKSLSSLQKDLYDNFGEDSKKVLYALGKIQGKNGCNILIKKYSVRPSISDLSFFMEQTEFVGIGRMKFLKKDFNKNNFKIRMEPSINANVYLKEFGKVKYPICDYVRGLVTGALQAVSRSIENNEEISLEGIEMKCIAKGENECVFEIKDIKSLDKKDNNFTNQIPLNINELNLAYKKETLPSLLREPYSYVRDPNTKLSSFLKNKLKGKPFVFGSKGDVFLLESESLITPLDIFVLFYYILRNRFGKKIDQIFYKNGNLLGKEFTKKIIKKFNLDLKNKNDQRLLFDQIGLFGLGKIEIVKFDIKNKNFIFRLFNSPSNHLKQLVGNKKLKSDFFISGIINGIIEELFNTKTKTIENMCVLKGDKYCLFKTNKKNIIS